MSGEYANSQYANTVTVFSGSISHFIISSNIIFNQCVSFNQQLYKQLWVGALLRLCNGCYFYYCYYRPICAGYLRLLISSQWVNAKERKYIQCKSTIGPNMRPTYFALRYLLPFHSIGNSTEETRRENGCRLLTPDNFPHGEEKYSTFLRLLMLILNQRQDHVYVIIDCPSPYSRSHFRSQLPDGNSTRIRYIF